MKRLLIGSIAMIGAALMVSGCGQPNPLTGKPITPADVVAATQAACKVVPTSQQITAAVDAANKTAATVESVAGVLCAAIAPVTVVPVAPVTAPAASPPSG